MMLSGRRCIVIGAGVAGLACAERLAARGQPETPPVVIPDLAPELMPQMQSAGSAAMAASFSQVVSSWGAANRVDAPGTDWPGGAYMANASQYAVVDEFWSGMSDLLGAARGISLADFDAAVAAASISATERVGAEIVTLAAEAVAMSALAPKASVTVQPMVSAPCGSTTLRSTASSLAGASGARCEAPARLPPPAAAGWLQKT